MSVACARSNIVAVPPPARAKAWQSNLIPLAARISSGETPAASSAYPLFLTTRINVQRDKTPAAVPGFCLSPTNGVSGAGAPASSKSGRQGAALEEDPPHWQVEHWPEAVGTDRLLDEICEVLRRYMVLPKHAAEAMALWVLHAWSIGAWEISPLLIVVKSYEAVR